MNLEEELSLINTQDTEMKVQPEKTQETQNQFQNNVMQNQFQNNVVPNQFQNNVQPQQMMNQSPVQTAQPSMVNPNQAASAVNSFNFSDFNIDPNKPIYDRNPLERLTGNQGEIFRIHFLPGASTKRVHVHYNAEVPCNFICLKDVYGTKSEDCCIKYGDSKPRVIIPVVVMPIVNGQPNNLMQGQPGKLNVLVLGPSQFIKLQDQANFAGVELTQCDIIASVDNPRFKSFNFTVAQNSFVNQIPNLNELVKSWNELATPENICKLAGRLIDRDTYDKSFSNYDKSKYDQTKDTPTHGTLDGSSLAFNNQNPYQPAYNQYGTPSQPMYQQAPYQPSYTQSFNQYDNGQRGDNMDSPWGNFGN